MIERQIDRPMPMPSGFVVWKGSKRRGRLSGRSPWPVSRTATHTPAGSILTVLMCNSRLPSSTPLIDWMALTIKFNITCCSCTRSPWMRGNSPASCVPTVTPVLTASLRVRAVTSRSAALRSTTSFRGGSFLTRHPIRSTTSLARSVSFTMQVSASRTSATSGGPLSKNQTAHYSGTHIRHWCTAPFRQKPTPCGGGEGGAPLPCERKRQRQRTRRPDRVSHQKSATPEGGRRPQCGDPGGDRPNPQRSGQDRRHGGHAPGGRVAMHPGRSGATAASDVEPDRQCHPVDERR